MTRRYVILVGVAIVIASAAVMVRPQGTAHHPVFATKGSGILATEETGTTVTQPEPDPQRPAPTTTAAAKPVVAAPQRVATHVTTDASPTPSTTTTTPAPTTTTAPPHNHADHVVVEGELCNPNDPNNHGMHYTSDHRPMVCAYPCGGSSDRSVRWRSPECP